MSLNVYYHHHMVGDSIANEEPLRYSITKLFEDVRHHSSRTASRNAPVQYRTSEDVNKHWNKFKHLPLSESRIKYAIMHTPELNYEMVGIDQLWIIILYTATDSEAYNLIHKCETWCGLTSTVASASLHTIWDLFRNETATSNAEPWSTASTDDVMGPYESEIKSTIGTVIQILKLRCYLALTGLPAGE
ncbi:hypothetical protein KC359_g8916 [Hortaea werneckii]|nr:hypothetical protein KC359_g8916 [Hortaea werneckii]